MGHAYRAVGWNRQKRLYDATLVAGVLLYLGLFVALGSTLDPAPTLETLLIRGLGTAAFVLLHLILCIGPLARLDARFLPLLYNRRHMGVTMFFLALSHGVFSTIQYHALGDRNPLVSLLTSNTRWDSLTQFPFELLGLAGLAILFAMAATSHDFWLSNLSAPVWKSLHMLVYPAYTLLVMHVVQGVQHPERSPRLAGLHVPGAAPVLGLQLSAGLRERRLDRPADHLRRARDDGESWTDVF
jgi:DMSO/TMAO reductase YedYZ heme-binding membrane subunit